MNMYLGKMECPSATPPPPLMKLWQAESLPLREHIPSVQFTAPMDGQLISGLG